MAAFISGRDKGLIAVARRPEENTVKSVAAIACEAHKDFTIEAVDINAPRAGEVLVRIAGVGLCHTDLIARATSSFRSRCLPFSGMRALALLRRWGTRVRTR